MKNPLLLVILLSIFGCQSTADTERGYTVLDDKFKNASRYAMVPVGELDGAPMLSLSQAFIDIFAYRTDKQLGTTMAIILHFEDWAMISPGESLIIIADGERLTFRSPLGSNNNGILKGLAGAVGGVRVREEAHYAITTDQIKKLAYSTNVEVAVYGSKQSFERTFSPKHISSIRNFYEKFILPNGVQSL